MDDKKVRSITPFPPANYTPTLQPFQEQGAFRFWCQTVLPNIYDDSLSYYELLTKVVEFLNVVIENNEAMHLDVENLLTAYNQLQQYVNDYFSSLDVQEEINNKLDDMVKSGEFLTITTPTIIAAVEKYLRDHLTNTSPPVDNTLQIAGAAADSKTVGDKCFWNRGLIPTTTTPTDETNFLYNHTEIGRYYVGTSNARRLQDLPDEIKNTANGLMVLNFPSIQANAFIFQLIFTYKASTNTSDISNYPIFYRNVFPDSDGTGAFPKYTSWTKILNSSDMNVIKNNAFLDNGQITTTTTPTDETNFLKNHLKFGRFFVTGSQVRRLQDLPKGLENANGLMLLNFPSIQANAFIMQMIMVYDGVNANLSSSYPIYYRNVCTVESSVFPETTPWQMWLQTDTTFSKSGYAADSLSVGNKAFLNRGKLNPTTNADDPVNYLYNYTDIGRYACGTSNSRKFVDLPAQLKATSGGIVLLNFPSIQDEAFTLQILMSYIGSPTTNRFNYPIYYRNVCNIKSTAFPKASPWQLLSPGSGPMSLSKVQISLIGDSITEKNFRATTGWAELLAQQGAVVQNLAKSSHGFIGTIGTNNYLTMIPNIKSNVQLIGVNGSFNDLKSSLPMGTPQDAERNTICGCINDFFEQLITKFPTVPVLVYMLNPWGRYHYGIEKSDQYVQNLEEICKIRGLPFKSLYTSCSLYPWIPANATEYFTPESQPDKADTTHPNSKGQALLFQHLLPFFLESYPNLGSFLTEGSWPNINS